MRNDELVQFARLLKKTTAQLTAQDMSDYITWLTNKSFVPKSVKVDRDLKKILACELKEK